MKRDRSLRFRLTVWYALILVAALSLFSGLIWLMKPPPIAVLWLGISNAEGGRHLYEESKPRIAIKLASRRSWSGIQGQSQECQNSQSVVQFRLHWPP